MSKINQIEQALRELEGGAFQKLANCYLAKKGYSSINSIGSVIGNNKVRKGTPDSLITLPNGNYIFCEYTTQDSEIFEKFIADLEKCFNEEKTGIQVAKIEQVFLFHNGSLSTKSTEALNRKCFECGVRPNILGLSEVSYDLLVKYPDLARDHLNIEVDTGQIVNVDSFKALHDKSKLTTSIQTSFRFRTEIKATLLQQIRDSELALISGGPGIGKTRLALECIEAFREEQPATKVFCIFNKGPDLFDDCRAYFSDVGDYLIFVDDCNRVSGFEYILHLLREKRPSQSYRIVATVRNYALDKVKDLAKEFTNISEISLEKLSDDQIKELLAEEYNVQNPDYQNRITDISDGNPRLAIMAANIALKTQDLNSIRDVTGIYEEYFATIRKDLATLQNSKVVKVAGILSFFRTYDKSNEQQVSIIENHFDVTEFEFWQCCQQLHEMEIVDIYEAEVAKLSDQVMSTYLFYLCFFKEKQADFGVLLTHLFPDHKKRLTDSFYPVINTFDYKGVTETVQHFVDRAWRDIDNEQDKKCLAFLDIFWFLKPTEVLTFAKRKVDETPIEDVPIEELDFEKKQSSLPQFLTLLPRFKQLEVSYYELAIDILLSYLAKKPSEVGKFIHLFTERLWPEIDAAKYGYVTQRIIFEKIITKAEKGSNVLFTKLCLKLIPAYFKTELSQTTGGRNNTFTVSRFTPVNSCEFVALKKMMLNFVENLFDKIQFELDISFLMHKLASEWHEPNALDNAKGDSELLLPILCEYLQPDRLLHCIIARKYLKQLNRLRIDPTTKLQVEYKTNLYCLYETLFLEDFEIESKLGTERYLKFKSKKVAKYAANFQLDDFRKFFEQLAPVVEHNKQLVGVLRLQEGFECLIEYLTNHKLQLLNNILKAFASFDGVLKINPFPIVRKLIPFVGKGSFFDIVAGLEKERMASWLFPYYMNIPEEEIQQEDAELLKTLYRSTYYGFYHNFYFLLKFEKLDKNIVVSIIQTLIDRSKRESKVSHSLEGIFQDYCEEAKAFRSKILENSELIQQSYILADTNDSFFDYKGKYLSEILDRDPHFIQRLLSESKPDSYHRSEKRDYSFVWSRNDCSEIMTSVEAYFLSSANKYQIYDDYSYFYKRSHHPQKDKTIIAIQDEYLANTINKNPHDKRYIRLLFTPIAEFEYTRKLKMVQVFLKANQIVEDFKQLSFEPLVRTYNNRVSILTSEMEFLEQISEICNTIELLEHKTYLEDQIACLRDSIQKEKKRKFMDDD